MKIIVRHSESIGKLPWGPSLGVVVAEDVDVMALQRRIPEIQDSARADAASHQDRVLSRIRAFENFFAQNGFRSPLSAQFEQRQRTGKPPGNPLVHALLLAETQTGLLMGAQNAEAIQGDLVYDLAHAGETFAGMRSEIRCAEKEIILRDQQGIIASLFQGPDHRTRLSRETRNVAFLIFSVPAISTDELQEGVRTVEWIFQNACAECHSETYQPPAHA